MTTISNSLMNKIERVAKRGGYSTKVSICHREVVMLKNNGFIVEVPSGPFHRNNAQEMQVSWENVKRGTAAARMERLVKMHRYNNADQARQEKNKKARQGAIRNLVPEEIDDEEDFDADEADE